MATCVPETQHAIFWSDEAFTIVAQAKLLSGIKLEQLLKRLQRHSGQSKDACWRFIMQHGIKSTTDHRRWSDQELDQLREELVKRSIEEIAARMKRSPNAIRSILRRKGLRLREIRCDVFSVESLAHALRVGRNEVLFWIHKGWLIATEKRHGQRCFHSISPEALTLLYKKHLPELLRRGLPSQTLFEAYLDYCHVPKHTTGEQLLDVRRDKREREAFNEMADGAATR